MNYDTPMTTQIHASSSQLSAPGSYMLAPSYSEALLMEPAMPAAQEENSERVNLTEAYESDMVPSYSEALLYERAQLSSLLTGANFQYQQIETSEHCECPCHFADSERQTKTEASTSRTENKNIIQRVDNVIESNNISSTKSQDRIETSTRNQIRNRLSDCNYTTQLKICSACLRNSTSDPNRINRDFNEVGCSRLYSQKERNSQKSSLELLNAISEHKTRNMVRDISEPDLRSNLEFGDLSKFLRVNVRSLENILEKEETDVLKMRARSERAEALVLEDQIESVPLSRDEAVGKGAIPKKFGSKSRVTVNPISEVVKRIPTSRTYFCLKSILKTKQRRYTLVTPEEFETLDPERGGGKIEFCGNRDTNLPGGPIEYQCSTCDDEDVDNIDRELPRMENLEDLDTVNGNLIPENPR